MSKMTNIIHITGNDSYGVELELKRWILAFEKKFGNINIDRFDLSDPLTNLKDILLSGGLFAEKRLFIFRGGRDRKSKSGGFEELLEQIHKQLPPDHFLLFHNVSTKEESLLAWLGKHADTRSIDTLWSHEAWESRYHLNPSIIRKVLTDYKHSESLREKGDTNSLLGHEVAHTLEMIELSQGVGMENFVHGYTGDTLFALVDTIMATESAKSLAILNRVQKTIRVDEWMPSLIGLLRNNVYIKYLQSRGQSEKEIANRIKVHPFVLSKGYRAHISYEKLKILYQKIIQTSIAYKRGKGMKESELGRILAIELALLDLKKDTIQ